MDRKQFLKNSLASLGAVVALPSSIACSTNGDPDSACALSPSETIGPFPIKTPADLVRENIISDRTGVALLITLTVQDKSNGCKPLAGVFVDIWHCDADGNYSEYGANQLQAADYRAVHFLRGRQTTDANGVASFISIFPGWYPGRAPHIHLEILDANENSIRVTQIAFPDDVSDAVYASPGYQGPADTSNNGDNIFANSLDGNMADSVTGNPTDGYTLLKTIIV